LSVNYTRPLSPNERLFLVAEKIISPYANQMVLEGKGVLDASLWQNAVQKASEANPGSRLVLKRFSWLSYWRDSGRTPPLREAECNNWNGSGSDGAEFLKKKFNPKKGPTAEVLLLHGEKPRVVFRTFHSVMDGRGTMTWAEDIFRHLRGEPLIGTNSVITDQQLMRSFQNKMIDLYPHNCLAPTGVADSSGKEITQKGITWKRITLKGHFSKLLPRTAVILANEARAFSHGTVRFAVPVDLRPRHDGLRSTANLTNALYIEVTPKNTAEQVSTSLKVLLDNKTDGMLSKGDDLIKILPVKWMYRYGKKELKKYHEQGLYRNSGILSNLGRIDLEKFTGGGFLPETCFFIPPCMLNIPLFMTFTGAGEYVEILISVPKILSSNGRIEKLANILKEKLSSSQSIIRAGI